MESNATTALPEEKRRGLDGAALKWIAVVTMLIDHTAVMVFETWLIPARRAAGAAQVLTRGEWMLYGFLRSVGRLAFPIFCFLLVEGFFRTRDRKKYLGRLLLFGLLSELPFDYALYGSFSWTLQNVYFTLFLGLLGVWGISAAAGENLREQPTATKLLRVLGCVAAAAGTMAAALLLHTDYSAVGVAAIILFYLLHGREAPRDAAVGLCILGAGFIEAVSWVDFILFHRYNGERGRQPKYFFYAFYPGHLALLWLIRYLATGA